MDETVRKHLEDVGYVFGDAEDFLGLTEEERRLVDERLEEKTEQGVGGSLYMAPLDHSGEPGWVDTPDGWACVGVGEGGPNPPGAAILDAVLLDERVRQKREQGVGEAELKAMLRDIGYEPIAMNVQFDVVNADWANDWTPSCGERYERYSKFFGTDRYQPILDLIYAGLGIPADMTAKIMPKAETTKESP